MAEGKKLHGSDAAWDVAANAAEHASDMAALLRHNAAPSVAGNIMLDNATNWVSVDAIGYVPFVPTARGDMITASATLLWQPLALGGTTGSFLRRDATDPGWSTLTLPNAATKGDLLVATAANAIGNVVDVAAGQPLLSGGIGLVPAYAGWNLVGTAGQTYTLPSVTGTLPGGSGVAGQVAEWVTDTHTLQAAKLIGPAVNILTITNTAASTLGLAISAGKTLTLTATGDFNLTVPATGTVALLGTANVFTLPVTFSAAPLFSTMSSSWLLFAGASGVLSGSANATLDANGYATFKGGVNVGTATGATLGRIDINAANTDTGLIIRRTTKAYAASILFEPECAYSAVTPEWYVGPKWNDYYFVIRTWNGTTGNEVFVILPNGNVKIASLAGAGSRTVVAAADGTLSAP